MSYKGLILLQNPEFYLPLEETSGGSATDITGNGYTGTYNNITLSSPNGFSIFGGPVTYATWNGTSSNVSIAKRWIRGGCASFSMWCKPTSIAGWSQLFNATNCVHDYSGPTVYAVTDGTGYLALVNSPWNNGGSNNYTATASAITAVNVVMHVAVVFNGQVWKVYVNGANVITVTGSGSVPQSSLSLPMRIGAGYTPYSPSTPVDFFAGWISNLAAFNRPLSAAEILAQYNVGKANFDQPYISGTVLDNGSGASKRIKWMRRDSGVLVAAGTSAADGSFTLKTTSDIGMAVCLDDAVSNYEPLIFDRVTPST